MHKSLAIGFLGLALILVGFVRADAAVTNAKIGFIDLERTLYETDVGKAASKRFESTRKGKQDELDKKQKALQEYATSLEKQRALLKPEVLKQRQAEMQKQYVEVQELYVNLERDLASERAKLLQGILKKAAPIIKDVAKNQGYTMIVDRNAVLWANDALDITDDVNKRIK